MGRLRRGAPPAVVEDRARAGPRALLARAHKKSYTITVGKLNPAKLGNFLEIECFVLVACPENSLVESKVWSRAVPVTFFSSAAYGDAHSGAINVPTL